jgi:hypothetical protein
MGNIHRTKSKTMWLIKINNKKKIKKLRDKLKKINEKTQIPLSPNEDNNHGQHRDYENNN